MEKYIEVKLRRQRKGIAYEGLYYESLRGWWNGDESSE